MSMRVSWWSGTTGQSLAFSIVRWSDFAKYDFPSSVGGSGDGTFKSSPATLVHPLTEFTSNIGGFTSPYIGTYQYTLVSTPVSASQFSDGYYLIFVHNSSNGQVVGAPLISSMVNGDDNTTALPSTGFDNVIAEAATSDNVQVNARQALSMLLSDHCGLLSGAPGGPITVSTPHGLNRIIYNNLDGKGNRLFPITWMPPA